MTATAVLPRSVAGRPAAEVRPAGPAPTRAVAYQRVLHQMVRRELRLLAELSTWAPAGDVQRTAALTRHGELVSRILLHHHAVERDRLWPALQKALPASADLACHLTAWRDRCAG